MSQPNPPIEIDDAAALPMAVGSVAVVIPAAGSGTRFRTGDGQSHPNKLFAPLAGKPLWLHSLETLLSQPEIGRLLIGVSAADQERFQQQAKHWIDWDRIAASGSPVQQIEWFLGGQERSDTVAAALNHLENSSFVAIHDAARPLLSKRDFRCVLDRASKCGAAILATPVTGTLKRANHDQTDCHTVDRSDMWIAQTPQVIRVDWWRDAIQRDRGRGYTDDAQIVGRAGYPIAIVAGSPDNLKITYPADLTIAEAILQTQKNPIFEPDS